MRRATYLIPLLAAVLAAGCGSSKKDATPAAPKPAKRSGFSANVTNPWFPLRRGSVYRYRGVKDGEPSREVMIVTGRTETIDGAPCVAISDRLWLSGRLEERTTDWYTQDAKGNVLYFGERTAELDAKGRVKNTSGSWRAGVHGAKPGIFMFADPGPGRSARQEYLKGEAEDLAKVKAAGGSVKALGRAYARAVTITEWTPLEPKVIEEKTYAPGIGQVNEVTVAGSKGRFELVSFTPGKG